MNYWPRWIGAIRKRTNKLSLAQMGAYDRLLDEYYAEELPLPADLNECYRVVGALTRDEQQAVRDVLARFFTLTPDGYRNERADEEIQVALPKIAAAQANGKLGGRPRKPKQEPSGFSPGIPPESQDEPASKHPHPHPSSPTSKKKRAAPPTDCPADVDPQVWSDWVDLRTKKRTTASATAVDGARAEAAKAGMTLEAFLRIWCARGSQGLQADWLKPDERRAAAKSFQQADYDAKVDRINRLTGGLAGARPTPAEYIDMEAANAPATAIR